MISAKEAKNLAFAHKNPENNFEWTKEIVYKRIEDAAKLGDFELTIYFFTLPDNGKYFDDVKEVLISDGYKCGKVCNDKNYKQGNYILISWKGSV